MDHVNNKTETECECAHSYQHHTTIEVNPEGLYSRSDNQINEQFNEVLEKNKVLDDSLIEKLIIESFQH